jgi:hypothetical protein
VQVQHLAAQLRCPRALGAARPVQRRAAALLLGEALLAFAAGALHLAVALAQRRVERAQRAERGQHRGDRGDGDGGQGGGDARAQLLGVGPEDEREQQPHGCSGDDPCRAEESDPASCRLPGHGSHIAAFACRQSPARGSVDGCSRR